MESTFLWENAPSAIIKYDPNRDNDGRGTYERLITDVIGDYWITQTIPYITDFLSKNINPLTCLEDFLALHGEQLGDFITVNDNLDTLRRILVQGKDVNKLRGTVGCYKYFFNLAGFTSVELEAFERPGRYDGEMRYDSGYRYDNKSLIIPYRIILTGPFGSPLSSELLDLVTTIERFCQPLHAEAFEVVYNGQTQPLGLPSIYYDTETDTLFYDNSLSPDVTFSLVGDVLSVNAPDESNYQLVGDTVIYQQ